MRPERFELPTYCSGGLAARRIKELDGVSLIVTECHRSLVQRGFPVVSQHFIALGRVWWWAQNWAQIP